ncbi:MULTISPECIES: ATP-binding protein [unclassified Myxococcus]|uniref:ATP-binding protein n=1 Tax=Myxococcus TaxID=32 RepID=UPI001EF004D9|nr:MULTISPECIES: ATP-binding protein [unclassified Myxococcus]
MGLLADAAWMYRENKKLSARLQHAKLRQQACLEDIDYTHARGLTNPQVLSTSKRGPGKHNVLLTGPTVRARASWRALGMRSPREVRLAASPLCPCPI